MRKVLMLLAVLAAPAAGPAAGAQATQDWPCIQPRQPHLSLGQMWAGPPADAASDALARGDAGVAALADRLAQRRLGMDEAAALIAAEAPDAVRLTALMQAVLAQVDAQRSAIMDGIARYGHGQAGLAAGIAARRATLASLEAAAKPDYDAIDAEEQRLDWDLRIFDERRQMLTAVCESPVLLEQRAFELARLIAAQLPAIPTPAP